MAKALLFFLFSFFFFLNSLSKVTYQEEALGGVFLYLPQTFSFVFVFFFFFFFFAFLFFMFIVSYYTEGGLW